MQVTLETVESSNVYAIGYDAERQRIVVVFKAYEYPATPEEFAALRNAPSKGIAVAELGRGLLAGQHAKAPDNALMPLRAQLDSYEPDECCAGRSSDSVSDSTQLDSYEPDECCAGRLNAALLAGLIGDEWTCDRCGCVWQAQKMGPVRYWSPAPMIEVI